MSEKPAPRWRRVLRGAGIAFVSLLALLALLLFWFGSARPPEDPSLTPAFDASRAAPPPELVRRPASDDRRAFFGDLHIHTALSADAYVFGVRAMPGDAYRFAKGASLEHGNGSEIRLSRPLDFAAVTDHSEFLGITMANGEGTTLSQRSLGDRLRNDGKLSLTLAYLETMRELRANLVMDVTEEHRPILADAWATIVRAAEEHYEPGAFTTFIGYEWTRGGPNGTHLHRNVIYGGSRVPERASSSRDLRNARDLWRELDRQREEGIDVIAIPHNSNLSNGMTFALADMEGNAFDETYIRARQRNEPLAEIFQVKGTSETHPSLSAADEFADFEIQEALFPGELNDLRGGYARAALRRGLEVAEREGLNPFDFGVIGSSDGHGAASPIEEDNFFGKLPMLDGSAAIRLEETTLIPKDVLPAPRWGAAGLAGVWAEENTRESLFAALERKETFATSGPRLRIRMFGGWDLDASLLEKGDAIREAYERGVPMGGTLQANDATDAPRFLVWAVRDAQGANLDRLQIIKGWVDASGVSHERVFEVAASDGREPDESGRVAALASTVDVGQASYSNSIGTPELSAFWSDPSFDPTQRAFYYPRVIEIPTPRWSTYDAKRLGVEPPEPHSIQERAVGSAIWVEPAR